MPKIELYTTIEERIECEDIPGFTIKKINLGKNYFWAPQRGIYLSTDIPKNIRNKVLGVVRRENGLIEINRTIYKDISYKTINYAIEESDENRIKDILRVNDYLSNNAYLIISLSFSDFPSIKVGDNFEELLDYIYAFSSTPFVPHVRYGESKTSRKYSAKDFCKYVDNAINIFQEKNIKPLFVPFDIEYNKPIRDEILIHYAKQGYTNIWIDFKGRVFSKTMVGKIRTFWRKINKKFGEDAKNIVVYFTNIKKIPRVNPRDAKISPSDFLAIFSYGDIIGAPWKGIMRGYESEEEKFWIRMGYTDKDSYKLDMFGRDCSIFENETYYYVHPDKIKIGDALLDNLRENISKLDISEKYTGEKISYSISGILTSKELDQIKKIAENNRKIADYISRKEFFQKEGFTLLNELKKSSDSGRKEKSIFDF